MKTILNRAHLESLSIRRLKAMCPGKGITKARYGKPWSDMAKAELVQALSDYHRVMNSAPKSSHWQTTHESNRITIVKADGHLWTVCIGFATQQQANRFFYWLLPRCSWALVRRAERTGCQWEVKVWGMSKGLLDELVARDTPQVSLSAMTPSTCGIAGQKRPTTVGGVAID